MRRAAALRSIGDGERGLARKTRSFAPLCTMARWNRLRLGDDINESTLPAPADSPKIVTRSGSRRTQRCCRVPFEARPIDNHSGRGSEVRRRETEAPIDS